MMWTIVNPWDAVAPDSYNIWFCHDPHFAIKARRTMPAIIMIAISISWFFTGAALVLGVRAAVDLIVRLAL